MRFLFVVFWCGCGMYIGFRVDILEVGGILD